jgi:hypothetical protein
MRIEEERPRHPREVRECVFLAIGHTRLLHEPIVRDPHAGDGLASGPADLGRLLQHDHAGAQFVRV